MDYFMLTHGPYAHWLIMSDAIPLVNGMPRLTQLIEECQNNKNKQNSTKAVSIYNFYCNVFITMT